MISFALAVSTRGVKETRIMERKRTAVKHNTEVGHSLDRTRNIARLAPHCTQALEDFALRGDEAGDSQMWLGR